MTTPNSTGNSCHFQSALFAEFGLRLALAVSNQRRIRRLPRSAQLPPAALFAALARGTQRRPASSWAASGMRLANGSSAPRSE